MRSHIAKATRRSCVIMIRPMPRETWTDLSSARISRWVVTSSAVDGSSAIRIFGSRASAAAMPDALAHAPRQLERIALGHAGIADADLGEAAHGLVAPLAPAEPVAALVAQLLVDVPAAAQDRVEHRERVLEDEPDLWTRGSGRSARSGSSSRLRPAVVDLALGVQRPAAAARSAPSRSSTCRCPTPPRSRSSWTRARARTRAACAARAPAARADRGPRTRRDPRANTPAGSSPISALAVIDLPLPDSPTMPIVSPRASARSMPDTIVRVLPPMREWIVRSETVRSGSPVIGHVLDRRGARTASRPSRLTVVAVATSTNAGARAATGFWKSRLRLSEIMRPQSAVPGPAPRPR